MAKPEDPGRLLARRTSIASKAPALTEVLRGTLRERYVRCGKAGCRCERGQGHGPFVYLSVTLGVGRTTQITVAAEDQAAARQLVRNYERVQQAVEAISAINRQLLQRRTLPPPPAGAPHGERVRAKRRRVKDG
jgi:hypothetical protein